MSPAANGPRDIPSSSLALVSQRLTGGVPWSGSDPPPIHGAEAGNVRASFEPGSGRPVLAWVDYDFHRRHGPDALMVAAGDPRRIR